MNRLKIVIDFLMLFLMIILENGERDSNLSIHAICGIIIFVLFIFHHILNYRLYLYIFKGKYNFHRSLFTFTDAVLGIAMIFLLISSYKISGLALNYDFLPTDFYWKNIHLISSSWIFIIIAFHISLHTLNRLKKIHSKLSASGIVATVSFITLQIIFIIVGIFSFSQSKIFSNMFLLYTDASSEWNAKMQYIFTFSILIAVVCLVNLSHKIYLQRSIRILNIAN